MLFAITFNNWIQNFTVPTNCQAKFEILSTNSMPSTVLFISMYKLSQRLLYQTIFWRWHNHGVYILQKLFKLRYFITVTCVNINNSFKSNFNVFKCRYHLNGMHSMQVDITLQSVWSGFSLHGIASAICGWKLSIIRVSMNNSSRCYICVWESKINDINFVIKVVL